MSAAESPNDPRQIDRVIGSEPGPTLADTYQAIASLTDSGVRLLELIQAGAEIYGHPGVAADLEILALACRSLAAAGARDARVGIGHVAVFRAIVRAARVGAGLEAELFEALQKKDARAVTSLARALDSKTKSALALLPELYGGPEVLVSAGKRLPKIPELTRALATLRTLSKACPIPASFDLAELRGYHYHSGVVFDAYCKGVAGPVARGGRYDEVGRAFGRSRPATGFSIDLRSLAGASAAPQPRGRGRRTCR